jgi:hypothetical protein
VAGWAGEVFVAEKTGRAGALQPPGPPGPRRRVRNDERVTTAQLFQVDAFAPAPFAGNPAAVLVLEDEPEEEFGPLIGAELNQPVTALVWPAGGRGRFGLRWFTARAREERGPGRRVTRPAPGQDVGKLK